MDHFSKTHVRQQNNHGPADRRRSINMHEDYEARYWCKHFGETEARLRAAVGRAGTSAAAVRTHLDK